MRPTRQIAADPWLTLVMVVAVAINAALLALIVVLLVRLAVSVADGWALALFVIFLVFAGATAGRRVRAGRRGRAVRPDDEPRLRALVARLCLTADVRPPEVEVENGNLPLTWTLALPFRRPTIHVTTGLIDRLDDAQLEAALAHELAHAVHGDATAMTLLAAPGVWTFYGIRRMWEENIYDPRAYLLLPMLLVVLGPPALLLTLTGRWLSRQREFVADRWAAQVTGSPAAVAAALVSVSEGLAGSRARDLRRAAARDVFHFVPAREAVGIRRLYATHPRVARRIERLRRFERRLQETAGGR